MNLTEKLNRSFRYVCNNSKSVKINYDQVDAMIGAIKKSPATCWLDSNPYGLMDMNIQQIVNFLLIYHTIGDYCFWGDPKWEIKTKLGTLDGSYAIMYLMLNRFKASDDFNMSFNTFKNLLKGNVTIPLLRNRYQNLAIMNDFLQKNRKTFYELTSNMYVDSKLLEFIVKNLNYFDDTATYNGKNVLFYKRAQLLASDILHAREIKEKAKVDYTHLVGCADYKIPQVMRCYEMLEFDDNLAKKVDSKIRLPSGSPEEIEIRANTLMVIDYIYEKTGKAYPRMSINDSIWLLGQDKTKMTKPYHRTLTSHY